MTDPEVVPLSPEEALRALSDAATPGEWSWPVGGAIASRLSEVVFGEVRPADARLIVAAVNYVRALLSHPRPPTEWTCDWTPDELNPGPECPYCAGQMCAQFDGLNCTHDRAERHGESHPRPPETPGLRLTNESFDIDQQLDNAIRAALAARPPEPSDLDPTTLRVFGLTVDELRRAIATADMHDPSWRAVSP